MVISEKDISQNESKNHESPKGKKIIKILLIAVAVLVGLSILGSMSSDDESEKQELKNSSIEEKVVTAGENDSVKSDSVSGKTIKPLTLSDLKFGTKKKGIFNLFEDKGWSFNGESNNLIYMDSAFMFNVHDTALFQNYISYRIDVGFDEDDNLQDLFVCFDVSPDAMERQKFSTLDEVLFALSADCLEKEGYKRVGLLEEAGDFWCFEKGEDLAWLYFPKKWSGAVVIQYSSKVAIEKRVLK